MCAKTYFKEFKRENLILDELSKLQDQFLLFKNVFLRLKWPVTYTKTSETIKSCQIDYVVIGPPGVVIVEAKKWDESLFTELIPHKETDKAGLIVYIKLKAYFNKKIPIYNIVTTLKKIPIVHYGFVHQLSVWDLTTFIYNQENCLSKSEIRQLGKIFKRKFS